MKNGRLNRKQRAALKNLMTALLACADFYDGRHILWRQLGRSKFVRNAIREKLTRHGVEMEAVA